jgi:hypothetical protein
LAGESLSTRTIRNIFAPGFALTLLLAAGTLKAAAKPPARKQPPKPTTEECLSCPSDATLTHDVNGKAVSRIAGSHQCFLLSPVRESGTCSIEWPRYL